MIIKSDEDHQSGELISSGGITDRYGKIHLIPFLVIRQATKQEYIDECKNEQSPIGMILSNDRFYEVSID